MRLLTIKVKVWPLQIFASDRFKGCNKSFLQVIFTRDWLKGLKQQAKQKHATVGLWMAGRWRHQSTYIDHLLHEERFRNRSVWIILPVISTEQWHSTWHLLAILQSNIFVSPDNWHFPKLTFWLLGPHELIFSWGDKIWASTLTVANDNTMNTTGLAQPEYISVHWGASNTLDRINIFLRCGLHFAKLCNVTFKS